MYSHIPTFASNNTVKFTGYLSEVSNLDKPPPTIATPVSPLVFPAKPPSNPYVYD